jgi:diacylglycerol kinase family enzyme
MVIIDGQKVFDGPVFQVIIGKSNYYAGKFALFKDASLSNGYFDVALFTHPNKLRFTLGCVRFFMRRNDTQRLLFRGKNIIVQTIEPVPTQLDGDLADDTPVEFQLIGQTLEVLVPAGV